MHSILSGRILLNLRGAKEADKSEIIMLKPSYLFPTIRPYSTVFDAGDRKPGSGLAFASNPESSRDARGQSSLSFQPVPGSPRFGAFSYSSAHHFPHPDDAPMATDEYVQQNCKTESRSVMEEWFGDEKPGVDP